MGESKQAQLGQLMDYGKLRAIHLLKLPKIEKHDIPSFIKCPKYEKAQAKLKQKMERYEGKVDRCDEAIQNSKDNIEAMIRKRDQLNPGRGTFVNTSDAQAVARYNDRLDQTRKMQDKIDDAVEKHDDLIDRRTEAVEEAQEALQELTLEALQVIDEDIVEVLDRCTEIVDRLVSGENTSDLIEAIDLCLIIFRIHAMFEDLIENNAARKDCRTRIVEVNQKFAKLCANEQTKNYLVDMYQRNQDLVKKNVDILHQVNQVLGSVEQKRLSDLTQPVDVALTEKINTSFQYKDIVDPAQLDAVIVEINKTITALKQNIAKANEAVKIASDFAKTGVGADQQAKTLLSSMKSNVDAMKNEIVSQSHFTVQLMDEAIIEDFFEKDVRSAVIALRLHLVGVIGEAELNNLVKGDQDRFSLGKAENAIQKANLLRLQEALNKIPAHIKKTNDLITTAESDIREAGKVPQQKADALKTELGGKYIQVCLPLIGLFASGGILGRIKTFEPAFRSTNQIYQQLANALLEKNKKMTTIAMIIGAILGLGGMGVFFGLNLGNSVAVNVGVPGTVLVLYGITVLVLNTVGKRLRSFLQK